MIRTLSLEEIKTIIPSIKESFKYIRSINFRLNNRLKTPSINYVSLPKISPLLTESLAEHYLNKMQIRGIKGFHFERGGGRKGHDLLAIKKNIHKGIELKATTMGAFQQLGNKDINADYLIWMHFGNFFNSNNSSIELYIVKEPHRFFKNVIKLNLDTFKKITKNDLIKEIIKPNFWA